MTESLVWAYREFENCYVTDENEVKIKEEGIWQAYTMRTVGLAELSKLAEEKT